MYLTSRSSPVAAAIYHFTFMADMFSVGNTFKLNFAYYRSWEGAMNAIETFTVKIQVVQSKSECLDLEQEYKDEVAQAQGCQVDAECQAFVGGSLSCGFPTKAINVAFEQEVKAFGDKWWTMKCHEQGWNCPMFSPLPPYLEVRGVCDAGTCKVEYVDIRAKEGDSCGDDINVQCADGLYCAFGLNWCGTPPVDRRLHGRWETAARPRTAITRTTTGSTPPAWARRPAASRAHAAGSVGLAPSRVSSPFAATSAPSSQVLELHPVGTAVPLTQR